jgi:hypothetical protein
MKKPQKKNKQKRPHIGLIAAAAVSLVLIVIASWQVFNLRNSVSDNNKKSGGVTCQTDDKELCIFFLNFNQKETFRANITSTDGKGAKTTSVFDAEGDKKSRVVVDGKGYKFEYIAIDKLIYFKATSGTWWKQALDLKTKEKYLEKYVYNFEEQVDQTDPEKKITYEYIGPDWVGDYYCFKYEITDPAKSGEKQYIWFDNQEFLLRRVLTQKSNTGTDSTITYPDIKISEPTPVKVLGPNQHVLPGKAEPETLPASP